MDHTVSDHLRRGYLRVDKPRTFRRHVSHEPMNTVSPSHLHLVVHGNHLLNRGLHDLLRHKRRLAIPVIRRGLHR